MYVRDLQGEEYALQAISISDYELNGNRSLSCVIYATKVNKIFIKNISEMWVIVDHDDVEHKIVYCKKKGKGNSLEVDIKAIPLFFDTLDNDRIYEEYNEHMTAQVAFDRIFEGIGFSFVIVDHFDAVQWEGYGAGESKFETFKRAIDRYKAEFRIVGNTVYLENRIGIDTDFMYRHRLNASNIVQELDASELWTYAKGYGDYPDDEDSGWKQANLVREYTSPLVQVIGMRHAPPIKDGRIKDVATMDAQLKKLVDGSLKISVSANIHILRKQGFDGVPDLGDRVFLIDERIGLNVEVRVIDVELTRNWKGEIIDLKLTFGSEGLSKRHQTQMRSAIKRVDNSEKEAIQAKNSASRAQQQAREAKQVADNISTSLGQHLNDSIRHITEAERNTWNNKAGSGDVQDILTRANRYTDGKITAVEGRASQYTDTKTGELKGLIDNMQQEIDNLREIIENI